MTPKIIYEDKNFIAVNKPAGLLVHPIQLKTNESTLVDFLLEKYPEIKNVGDEPNIRPGIVHRLDKDTSGVILAARTQKYFGYLKKLFQTHQIKKIYLALIQGKLESKHGVIEKPISLRTGSVRRTTWKGKNTKSAVTEYKVLNFFSKPACTLLEAIPKTGRTHQIRIHFSSIGHPIVGDKLYGPKESSFDRQFLHAQSLEFTTEDGKRIKIEADLPKELNNFLKKLTKNA